jgi:hypothetical protein
MYTTVQKFGILVFERKAIGLLLPDKTDQKYSVDIVNVVNDYCSWKWQIFLMEYLYRHTEAHYQQPSLLCSNGMLG